MSSRNSLFFKWSKSYPILKKIFLYYNVYISNFKFKAFVNYIFVKNEYKI